MSVLEFHSATVMPRKTNRMIVDRVSFVVNTNAAPAANAISNSIFVKGLSREIAQSTQVQRIRFNVVEDSIVHHGSLPNTEAVAYLLSVVGMLMIVAGVTISLTVGVSAWGVVFPIGATILAVAGTLFPKRKK